MAAALVPLLPPAPAEILASAGEMRALLWLPSGPHGPGPSPRLARDSEELDPGPLTLALWTVDGLALGMAEALEVLAALPLPAELPPDLRLGDDLRYWQAAGGLAVEALAGELVMPGLERVESAAGDGRRRSAPAARYRARWRPVLDGPRQAPAVEALERSMPAVCRAEAPEPGQAAGAPGLLAAFLGSATDAAVRGWAAAQAPRVHALDGAAEAWMVALFGDGGPVEAAPSRMAHLASGHGSWARSLSAAGDGPFRVALRLQAPDALVEADGPPPWRLHFLLQSRADPSLSVGAEDLWRAGGGLTVFGRSLERPQQQLLIGLAYVARLSAPVRRALRVKRPTEATLSTEEAYRFLRETAPVLELAGFGVLVPPWWSGAQGRLGLRVRLRSEGEAPRSEASHLPVGLGLDSLVAFDWSLAVGDATLGEDEFRSLVALRQPLVQVRGQWVQLDPFQVEAALRFFDRREARSLRLAEALHLALDPGQAVEGLPVEAVEATGELGEWLGRLRGQELLTPVPPPRALRATLRPYQQRGLDWLSFLRHRGLGGILADDMGLGKTVQTLAFLLHLRERGLWPAGDPPVLLLAPTSVVRNWLQEAARFSPGLRVLGHQGPGRPQGEALGEALAGCDLLVTSYTLLRRDREALLARDWAGLICDEAQNLKNPHAQAARLARELRAPWRLALTGTPVENRLTELWSILQLCLPGYLGPLDAFRREVAIPVERHGDEQALRRLRRLTGPFVLRRLKTDPAIAAELPAKTELKVYCHLTAEQAALYAAVVDDALADVESGAEGIERSGRVLRMLLRLKQVCNHPAQYLGQARAAPGTAAEVARSGKLGRLLEILEEAVAEGERALVFTQFREMGQLLRRAVQERLGVGALFLHGGVAPPLRERMVTAFQQDEGGPPVFVISLKAGGTGLNLTRASQVIHFDRWWNPAVEDQATDRAFRIGQTRPVLVHKFVCPGTLEEKIDALIEAKKALAQQAVGAGEAWLTQLSISELRELVTLRAEAMEG